MQEGQPGSSMNKFIFPFVLPIWSAWLSTLMPAAVGFYWVITNLFIIIQVLILQKFYSLDKLVKQSEIRAEQRRQAIANGTLKLTRWQKMAQKALEMQKMQAAEANNSKPQPAQKKDEEQPKQQVKLNSKGQKSRSQIKEEQRRRLAKSRQMREEQK